MRLINFGEWLQEVNDRVLKIWFEDILQVGGMGKLRLGTLPFLHEHAGEIWQFITSGNRFSLNPILAPHPCRAYNAP